jgi:hypothetical protein
MSYFPTIKFAESNLSAFGDLNTMELEPVAQIDGVYGLITQETTTSTSGTGATVDTNGSRFRLQSGTTATTGSAILSSVRSIKYRAGQSNVVRFTVAMGTPQVGNIQAYGVGTATNGYFFGYNGTTFGILHRNAGSETWIAQASWNVAPNFTITPGNGNVFMIKYPYLGYGDIFFFIQNATTGRIDLVHVIKYANTTATVQLSNPTMYLWFENRNTGANTTNVTSYVGSAGAFLSGPRRFLGPQFATSNSKGSSATETNILTLKNCTTFNGVANQRVLRIRSVSFGYTSANTLATLLIKKGVTLGGSPSYATISGTTADGGVTITSGQSVASVDTAGTTITGGTYIYNSLAVQSATALDLSSAEISLMPGDTLTLSAVGGVTGTIGVTINWQEE